VKVGDLVKIPRASIGIPAGTMALIVDGGRGLDSGPPQAVWTVHLIDRPQHPRRFLQGDLEIISE
jgi:hypothetical protein